ncbi:MAG: DUF2150 family protein [Halobacteriaceae archaeon]
MSAPEEEFYSEERWDNWLDRLREEDLDPEEEESARLLLNLQDDVAIAIAKILNAYEEDEIDQEETLEEIEDIREVVLSEPDIDDEDLAMLVDGVQTSLMSVFYSAEQYVAEGVANETTAEEYITAAADAETEEEFDRALGLVACAGTQLIDGKDLDMSIAEEIEYGYVTEWINGLDSLQSALSEPEVIEEEDEET